MSNGKTTRQAKLVTDQNLATKLPQLMPNASILVGKTKMTVGQIAPILLAHAAAIAATDSARQQAKSASLSERQLYVQVKAIIAAVQIAAAALFGDTSDEYAALGFTPRKPSKTTVATRYVATEKSKATREARGTKGKNQKKTIHGTVPAAEAPAARK
jgi:hypothetical protein